MDCWGQRGWLRGEQPRTGPQSLCIQLPGQVLTHMITCLAAAPLPWQLQQHTRAHPRQQLRTLEPPRLAPTIHGPAAPEQQLQPTQQQRLQQRWTGPTQPTASTRSQEQVQALAW